tara:strand:+ start:1792 stop:4020 length:2229 start_codon:yes stop_codon:yes gene_type:complete
MKVPLMAISNRSTVNKITGKQQVILWSRDQKLVIKSPRSHYYYKHGKGEHYEVLGKPKLVELNRYLVDNVGELNKDKIGPLAKIDGVTVNEVERIAIEHPEFFTKFTGEKPKSLCYDLEVTSADGSFPLGKKHPIVAIGYVTSDGHRDALLWDGESDKEIILKFAEFVKEYDPDIIYGYNVVGYDVPQLFARAGYHGLNIKPYFNRDNRADYGWETDFSYHKKDVVKAWGRVIVDVFNFTRKDYFLSGKSKSLKNVAREYGQEPIELSFAAKDILDYDTEEIKEYVISDCDATKWLFNHYFPQHLFIAELLGVPLESYINGADSFITKILQGRALFKGNILTLDKNLDRYPEIQSFQAAHIDLYQPGFHTHNYKVDFKSMYPSIAMALNLGPDTTTIVDYDEYDPAKFGWVEDDGSGYLVIPDNVINKNILIKINNDKKSCLYNMCKEFKEMREPYKKLKTHTAKSKSNALKMMVNTFYGANTNAYMTYGDTSVGIAITGIARWLIMGCKSLIQQRYGKNSVIYIHTDGVNTNLDVDINWVNSELQKGMDHLFPYSESKWIEVERDVFREGIWIAIGNYVLRNEDGTLTKHGSTFKSKSRSLFYTKVLDKMIERRLDNRVDAEFVASLYKIDNYKLEDFVQMRTMNQKIEDYKTSNDLIVQLATQAKEYGMDVRPGTTFSYYKTTEGYKLSSTVDNLDDIDVVYHWNMISALLDKFGLKDYVKKKPPLTLIDKKQKSLLEFV